MINCTGCGKETIEVIYETRLHEDIVLVTCFVCPICCLVHLENGMLWFATYDKVENDRNKDYILETFSSNKINNLIGYNKWQL